MIREGGGRGNGKGRGGGGTGGGQYETHTQRLWSNSIHICSVEENLSEAMWQPDTGYSGTLVFLLFIWKTSQIIALHFLYTCMCVMHE